MDANKLKVLHDSNYEIPKQCGLCRHAAITAGALWGVCLIRDYRHEKHTGPERKMSIYRGGSCGKFESLDESKLGVVLGSWREFLKR